MADAAHRSHSRPRLRAARRDAAPRTAQVAPPRGRPAPSAPRFSVRSARCRRSGLAAAVVLIPSFGALPGEPLYAVKGPSEDARVWFASGPREARIRLSLANERFEEVEQLIDNSHVRVMGGPGVLAARVDLTDIDDPALAHLIEGALRNAGEQLEAAARSSPRSRPTQQDLDDLVEVTTRGRTLATDVADELPNREQPPVCRAAVRLAKIEAKAKAAQQQHDRADRRADAGAVPVAVRRSPSPSPTPDAADGTPTPSPSPTLTPGDRRDAADAVADAGTRPRAPRPTRAPTEPSRRRRRRRPTERNRRVDRSVAERAVGPAGLDG